MRKDNVVIDENGDYRCEIVNDIFLIYSSYINLMTVLSILTDILLVRTTAKLNPG